MDYKKHLVCGLIGLIVLTCLLVVFSINTKYFDFLNVFGNSIIKIYGYAIPSLVIAFVVGLYSSILPDVDIATSKAFVITFVLLIIVILYFIVFTVYLLPVIFSVLIMLLILGLKHRGRMHSVLASVIMCLVFGIMFQSILVGIYVFAGFNIHLACDR